MDRLTQYCQIIRKTLSKYEEILNRNPRAELRAAVVFDEVHDHYLLTLLGWRNNQRIRGNLVHIRLHDGKIWIEEDGLEHGIANDFLDAGIPKDHIVLAFHHPDVRPLTEFAVA